jgi:GT2 family glycosyltransferase
MTLSPAFSVVIPVYNKWELTENCLKSLREHTPEYPFEVIVADNASSDATAVELSKLGEALFGEAFKRIRFEENRNFGPACNAGARLATAPLLFFLNNDTLLTPGWAPPLLEALEADPSLGGVGPLLLYEDNRVQHLGVFFSTQSVDHLYQGFPADHAVVKKRRNFQVVTAAAFLTPRKTFFDHEGFFEGYRNGFEDVDLCLRMHSTGLRFTCVLESIVYHLESRSPGRMDAEKHNFALLTSRCQHLRRMDLHIFGLDDGFRVYIDDCMDIRLGLAEGEELALLRAAKGKAGVVWLELIVNNPYWRSGRELVAERLEQAGHFAEALPLRAELAQLGADVGDYKKLFRCALRAGADVTKRAAEERLQKMYLIRQDRALAQALVARALDAAPPDDTILAPLYAAKLAAMFPE